MPSSIVRPPTFQTSSNTAIHSDEISATLDTANILPEGVRRPRKPRKEAYVTALERSENGELTSFHSAFSAFAYASTLYESDVLSNTEKSGRPIIHRLRRDSLPPEPRYYHQMLKHPHAEGFKEAMKDEIKALQVKNT